MEATRFQQLQVSSARCDWDKRPLYQPTHFHLHIVSGNAVHRKSDLPRIICLRLLDSNNQPLESELVPLTRSYDVSFQNIYPHEHTHICAGHPGNDFECSCNILTAYTPWNRKYHRYAQIPVQRARWKCHLLGWSWRSEALFRDVDCITIRGREHSRDWGPIYRGGRKYSSKI